MREALLLPVDEAIKAICTPSVYFMAESTARGMQHILEKDPTLRYAIAGHTHMVRTDSFNNGSQVYINTGTWTTHYALPGPDEITSELIAWLRSPDWTEIPLRDVTRFEFAFIRSGEGGSSSSVNLCVWEGGANGAYRILA
jgi:hypothetical protein